MPSTAKKRQQACRDRLRASDGRFVQVALTKQQCLALEKFANDRGLKSISAAVGLAIELAIAGSNAFERLKALAKDVAVEERTGTTPTGEH